MSTLIKMVIPAVTIIYIDQFDAEFGGTQQLVGCGVHYMLYFLHVSFAKLFILVSYSVSFSATYCV